METVLFREVATEEGMVLFLKNFLFTVIVPGTVAVYVPLLLASSAGRNAAEPWDAAQCLATAPLLLGAAIYFWCLWNFAFYGRGTPAPIDAPKHLVVRGPYRYVRNPMYAGVFLVMAGWALFFQSPTILIYGVCVAVGFHLFIVFYEEPTLRKKFGESYTCYCEQAGRWLPKISKR